MKYSRYIVLLVLILIYILFTVLSVEPFFETETPSYLLLLREPNESMLTKFIDVRSHQMAFDLSTTKLKSDFMTTYPSVITDIGGTAAFNNIFSRGNMQAESSCTAIAPTEASITSKFTGSAFPSLTTGSTFLIYVPNSTGDMGSVGGYALYDSSNAPLSRSAARSTIGSASQSHALHAYNKALVTPSLYVPWSCSTGCTLSSTSITPGATTTLPSSLSTNISTSVNELLYDLLDNYNRPHDSSEGCTTGKAYYSNSAGTTSSCFNTHQQSYMNDITPNINTYVDTTVKNYVKSADFQGINPGYTCIPKASSYVPTYLSINYPVPMTDTTPQPNIYYNAILLGRTGGEGGFKYRVIANEVGQYHVEEYLKFKTAAAAAAAAPVTTPAGTSSGTSGSTSGSSGSTSGSSGSTSGTSGSTSGSSGTA